MSNIKKEPGQRARAVPNAAAAQRRRARSPPTNTTNNATAVHNNNNNNNNRSNNNRQQAVRTTFTPAEPEKKPTATRDIQRSTISDVLNILRSSNNNNQSDIINQQSNVQSYIKHESDSDNDHDAILPDVDDTNESNKYSQPLTLPFKSIHDIQSISISSNNNSNNVCPPSTVGNVLQTHTSDIDESISTTQPPKLILFQLPTQLPLIPQPQYNDIKDTTMHDHNIKQEAISLNPDETVIQSDINDIPDDNKTSQQLLHDNLIERSTYSHITQYRPDDLRLYQATPDNKQYKLSELNSGYLGSLKIYKSGRTIMQLGINTFDVHHGITGSQHYQHAVCIDTQNKRYIPIAPVQHTLVTSMNI